jgi:hypothetical protein
MKIIILDDDCTVLFEQDNPGYIHLPIIIDGKDDIPCDDDNCQDPRCVERRREAEVLLEEWHRNGEELALVYHASSPPADKTAFEEFSRLPTHKSPLKVKLQSYTRNELVLSNGDRLKFSFPKLNGYSDAQVMFSTDKWDASLFPWKEQKKLVSRARA